MPSRARGSRPPIVARLSLRRAIERWALPGTLLLAFALRVYRLGDQNIWWDEGLAIWAVRKGLLGATIWTAQDVHPPLYFWGLWAWVRLVGESEFAARFISVAWGVLTVALAYALGSRLGGRRVGLVGAFLLAVARFHIWWSQEMRMYVLATLATTLTLYLAVRWLEEEREQARAPLRLAVGYVLAATACLYSIYIAALAPLVANVYALVALARIPGPRRAGVALRWYGAQAAALALLAPWLLFALPRMHSWSVAGPFGFRLFLELYGTLLTLGVSTDVQRYAPFLVPFAAVLLAGLATLFWPRRRGEPGLPGAQAATMLLAALLLLPVAVYLLTRPRLLFYTPRVEARYLVLFAPAFYLLLAWAGLRLARRARVLGLVAVVACLAPMLAFLPGYYAGRYLRGDMQTMARIVGACARPDDALILISGDRYQLFGYYYERFVPPARRIPIILLPQGEAFTAQNAAGQLGAATAGRRRFWVAAVETSIEDPGGLSLPWLDQHYRRALTYDVGYNALILYGDGEAPYLARRQGLAPQWPLQVQAGGLALLGYDLPGRECRPGDTVDLGLYWAAAEPQRAVVEWRRDSGELLQTVAQDLPPTEPEAGRASLRFRVWPWYQGGGTHFLVRREAPGALQAAPVRLQGPHIQPAPDRPRPERIAQPLDLSFGAVRLLGYDLHRPLQGGRAEARAGEQLTLDLFWQAAGPVGQDYTVFTHLVGATQNPRTGGPLWGQHDGPPVGGQYPTGQWAPGQLVADRHVLAIDAQAPPGDYELEVGLYLPATGERLRVLRADGTAGDDRVVVAHLRLE